MKEQLNIVDIIKCGSQNGIKNFLPILLSLLLWAVTCWIPYLNIGTTIAVATLPLQLSKGEVINPLGIFDGKYRKFMGEYFLTVALRNMVIATGFLFCIVPGFVIMMSYMFATLLVLDKGMNPTEALTESNKLTYGNKLMIFLTFLIFAVVFCIVSSILGYIWSGFSLILALLVGPIILSIIGYIYDKLANGKPAVEA